MPYIGKSPSAGVRQRYQYTATAGQTTFSGTDLGNLTLTYTDNNFVDVFQNGVLLKGGGTDYTATSGTSVVLATGASVSDVIEIIVYDVFSVGNFFNRTDSDSRYYKHSLGEELILDADGDTSITADTDDRVDIKVGGSDVVHVTSTGLGVGDTSPSHKLSVNGNVGISQGSTLFFLNDSGFSPSITNSGTVTDMIFSTNNSEAMRINSSNNLIVGKSTDSSSGSGLVLLNSGSNGGRAYFTRRDNTNTQVPVSFYTNAGTGVGSISNTSSSTSFNTSSDYRLKENIVTDWDATTRLKQLKPSRFNFIIDADTTLDGFLAHEVSSIVPEAITGKKDAVDANGNPDYQGIDQSKLVPLLTKALQESIARADALEARIKKLEDG